VTLSTDETLSRWNWRLLLVGGPASPPPPPDVVGEQVDGHPGPQSGVGRLVSRQPKGGVQTRCEPAVRHQRVVGEAFPRRVHKLSGQTERQIAAEIDRPQV